MKHTYKVTGMTCSGCEAKVSSLLSNVPGVTSATASNEKGEATVAMEKHIPTATLQAALKDYPKYTLTEAEHKPVNVFESAPQPTEAPKSWAATYKPILLIFGYVSVVSVIAGTQAPTFDYMLAMRVFMSGFFLTFSFFKLLDINAFADSYAMYDVVAKKFRAWGYIYVFVELGLGLAYALNLAPITVNAVTAVVMSVSLIGVLQSVLSKKTIRCACLGAVFNLPMSTVTIIEDGLMILMSLAMLAMYL